MDHLLTPETRAFRDEVCDFLRDNLPADLARAARRATSVFIHPDISLAWQRILHARGWVAPDWPVDYGGPGWDGIRRYIFAEECARAHAPSLAPQGLKMVAPVIMHYGSAAQKAALLPRILSGEDVWCQGYSEPGAGSDLAALRMRATRDGDDYVLNGSKIWTTHAQFANRMFCLVRTASGGKPQQGISFLCFDIPTPGITIRPIISISGDHELNQVFFDDVRVPAEGLIGEENQGWTIAKYLLQHERGGAWAPMLRARLRRLGAAADAAFAAGTRNHDEAGDMALRLAEMDCAIDALEATELQSLRAQARGEPHGIRPSMGKVLGSELRQRLTELGVEIAGHYAAASLPLDDGLGGELPIPEEAVFSMSAYLNDRAASIYAGSNEVQRNIVASHLLAR